MTTTEYLPAALKAFEQHRRREVGGFSPLTWAGEKAGLLAFVDAMSDEYGVSYLDGLEHEDVGEWWAGLELADSTRETRLGQLRSFLRYCRARGWLTIDPTALLSAPKPIPGDHERLTPDQLAVLPELAETPLHRIILALCANLGLRASEVRTPRVGWVHLDADEIHVQVHKTRQSERMPLTAELHNELSRWFTHYAEVCPEVTPQSYLVPSPYVRLDGSVQYRHTQPVGKNYPAQVVHEALDRLGWTDPDDAGVHAVRRSLARVFFDDVEGREGYDSALLATMSLLHHSRPETTLRYIGRDRAALARDRVLKGKPFLSRLRSGQGQTTVDFIRDERGA